MFVLQSRVYIIDTILEFVTPPDVTAGGGLSSLPAALGAQPELSFLVQVIAATLHAAELPSLTATLFAPTNAVRARGSDDTSRLT